MKELKHKEFENRDDLCKYVNEKSVIIVTISSQSKSWSQVDGEGYVLHTLWYYESI
jgi:hypothetical protein